MPLQRRLLVHLIHPPIWEIWGISVVLSPRYGAIFNRDLSVVRFVGHDCEKSYIDDGDVNASYPKCGGNTRQLSWEPTP